MLFILYVNDLFHDIYIENQKSVLMYANDTLLLNKGKTISETITNSQRSLDIDKMTINIGKTKFMTISPLYNIPDLAEDLYFRYVKLSMVHVNEYLGVLIDDKLTMGAHIDKVCTNVQKKYGILHKIRRYIREETAVLIYKVMIRPHLDYRDYY